VTRGRKPKPTALKVIEGNRSKTILRPDTIQPPKRSKPLAPPPHLTQAARSEWRRLALGLTQLGLLSTMDRAAFAAYCQAYGRWVEAERELERFKRLAKQAELEHAADVRKWKKAIAAGADPATTPEPTGDPARAFMLKTTGGNLIQHPLVAVANGAMRDVVKFAAEFGFTPAARARVSKDDPTEGSKYQGLIGARRA
jgi:P27 family predicted phage terminase small subunit